MKKEANAIAQICFSINIPIDAAVCFEHRVPIRCNIKPESVKRTIYLSTYKILTALCLLHFQGHHHPPRAPK
jgi:hypothetical protein